MTSLMSSGESARQNCSGRRVDCLRRNDLQPTRLPLQNLVHSFRYREGKLYCEDVDLARAGEQFGPPLYIYSAGTILDHFARLDAAIAPLDHLICYAVKANSNRAILKLLVDAGAGFDIVSGG